MISPVFFAPHFCRFVAAIQDSEGHHNTKMTMIYHHRDSIRPEDNITMLPLSRFYSFWDYGLVVIGWSYPRFRIKFLHPNILYGLQIKKRGLLT